MERDTVRPRPTRSTQCHWTNRNNDLQKPLPAYDANASIPSQLPMSPGLPIRPTAIHRASERADFRSDVLAGLQQTEKTLPCKYFYDQEGARLFEQICELKEYYLTRTEMEILRRHVREMALLLGERCLLVELGSGNSPKTRLLLEHLSNPSAYVPVDIAHDTLRQSVGDLHQQFPHLRVYPVAADFTQRFSLPDLGVKASRRAVYFPGSTIGNFGPTEASALLSRMAALCGPRGGLLIGLDLKKDLGVLLPAYNDAKGVTAAFNRNLLVRINRELGGDFRPEEFHHDAVYSQEHGRIEMYLTSACEQTVHIENTVVHFRAGERICTEYSYKYGPGEFAALASAAGFRPVRAWTDPRQWFSVQYYSVA